MIPGASARDDIMKITDSVKNVSSPSVGAANAGKSRNAPAAPVSSVDSGAGSIASTSPPLQALQSTIATSGAFDTQKVEAIKQAIAGGQFTVDTSKVANELISSVRSLLQSRGNQQA